MNEVNEYLSKYHEQDERRRYILGKLVCLKNETENLRKELKSIYKHQCEYSDLAKKNHKFWANNDRSVIFKIGKPGDGEFFLSSKNSIEEQEHRYYSSSIGILYHGENPITEEEYNSLLEEFRSYKEFIPTT